MIAILAPGQGAQKPGMFTPWLELDGVRAQLDEFSAAVGLDLLRLGTTADADEIKDTAITQPLIVALGVLVASQLDVAGEGRVAAGHSVGELTAAAVAGALRPADAVAFAGRRGAEMARACALTPTGMSAVLGGDPDQVVAAIEAADLTPANRNGAGQIVAAGSTDALAALAENPPSGARVRPLPVAGAFHTHYMASAEDALRDYVASLSAADPRAILLSNADGATVYSGAELLERLVAQVTKPVRWDLCLQSMRDLGVTGVLELAPAGTLVGIAKRELTDVDLLAIKTPDDLDAARSMLAERQGASADRDADFGVVVSHADGVFTRVAGITQGSEVGRGTQLGLVCADGEEHVIVSPQAGRLYAWLREDGDTVAAGVALARLTSGLE